MQRSNFNWTQHRWLMAFAVLALLSSAAVGFAKHARLNDSAYLLMQSADPGADCCMNMPCGPAGFTGPCCDWGTGIVVTASAETTPSEVKKDRASRLYPADSKGFSPAFVYADCETLKPDKAYSPDAGTATYLATARLRI